MPFFRRKSKGDKANERVSKRLNRSKAGTSPTREPEQEEPKVVAIAPPEPEPVVVEDQELSESESSDEESDAEFDPEPEQQDDTDTPMSAEDEDRSAVVFAKDFVEEFTEMVSKDSKKLASQTNGLCCT